MMNNLDKFKEKLKKGKICFGAGVWFSDPLISELFSELGFDFLWIDLEHTPNNNRIVLSHIMATKGTEAAPFVRIPGNEPFIVKPVLEIGPAAIIFPFINDKEDAIKAVKSCRYPPDGVRGYGPIRSNRFYLDDPDEYFQKSKSDPWVILQIEHKDAVKNLDEILEVPGFNSIVIGPNDLSNSVGLYGQVRSKEVFKVIEVIAEKANKKNIPLGIALAADLKDMSIFKSLKNIGINWISMTSDLGVLRTQPLLLLEAMSKLLS
jgi:2-keto-3-deoxy-L-rhamnonate aldolase RhmA